MIIDVRTELEEVLAHALEESVKLQSHYANLLNMYDGGRREQFKSAQEWVDKLFWRKYGEGKND